MSTPDTEEVFEGLRWQKFYLVSDDSTVRILLIRKKAVRGSNDEYGEILKILQRTTQGGLDIGRPIDIDVDLQNDFFIPTYASLKSRQSFWPVEFGRHGGKEWVTYPIGDLSGALRLQHLVTGWQIFGNVRGVSCQFNYKRHRISRTSSYCGSGQIQIWVHNPQTRGDENQLTPISTGSSRLSGLSLNSSHTLIQSYQDRNVMVVDEGWHPMLMLFLEANDGSGSSLWKIKNIFDFEAVDGPIRSEDAIVLLQSPHNLRVSSQLSPMKSIEHGAWNLCESTSASTGRSHSPDKAWEEWECGTGGITINFGKKLVPDNLVRRDAFIKELKKQRIIYNIKRNSLEVTRRTQTADIEAQAARTPPVSRPPSNIGVQPPSRPASLRVPDRPPEIPLVPLPHIPRHSLGLIEVFGGGDEGRIPRWEGGEAGNEEEDDDDDATSGAYALI